MRRLIEARLVQHHGTLIFIILNIGKSSLKMNMEEQNSITLHEAFKNIFILLLIGILISSIVLVLEILQFFHLERKHRKGKHGSSELRRGIWVKTSQSYFMLKQS